MIIRVFILLSMLIIAEPVLADDSKAFIGSWDLIRIESKDENSQWHNTAPDGTQFIGILMYSSVGKMQVNLYLSDRDHEILESFGEFVDGYVAYYADYIVDDTNKVITHKRLGHVIAENVIDVQRSYAFEGDLLILSPLPDSNIRLFWKRIHLE